MNNSDISRGFFLALKHMPLLLLLLVVLLLNKVKKNSYFFFPSHGTSFTKQNRCDGFISMRNFASVSLSLEKKMFNFL
jgi:hypothetical protein